MMQELYLVIPFVQCQRGDLATAVRLQTFFNGALRALRFPRADDGRRHPRNTASVDRGGDDDTGGSADGEGAAL